MPLIAIHRFLEMMYFDNKCLNDEHTDRVFRCLFFVRWGGTKTLIVKVYLSKQPKTRFAK
jgi:hypothetical protein